MTQILFRNKRVLKEFRVLELKLEEVFWWLESIWPEDLGPMEISSVYRTEEENTAAGAKTKIHCTVPHRALDLAGVGIPQARMDAIADQAKQHWTYDPSRSHLKLSVVYAKPHGTGPHFHLQVHPNTIRIA